MSQPAADGDSAPDLLALYDAALPGVYGYLLYVEDGWQVVNVQPPAGIAGGGNTTVAVPMYRVDDIAAAVERVRAAGGTATSPERQPYGISSDCVDDQGTRFYLGEL